MSKFTVNLDVVDVEAEGKIATVNIVKTAIEKGLDDAGVQYESIDVQAIKDE